ncbi:unnamed protein product [Meloidogyne enterolobii]|uniref:Uncharacterized protein n=2 Tax=Meloidogyne enterolobii TaxID=390850 RepID=A0ACB1B7T9_MELEN
MGKNTINALIIGFIILISRGRFRLQLKIKLNVENNRIMVRTTHWSLDRKK